MEETKKNKKSSSSDLKIYKKVSPTIYFFEKYITD